MAELEEEYARLQAQDRSASASVAAQAHDVAKARAVQNQARIWEQALGIRIAIQKPLASADRLPGAAAKRAAAEAAPGLEAAYGRARHACAAALATTLAAVDELLARQKEEETPEGKRTQERGGRKHDRSCSGDSSLEELWGDVEAASARLAPLRDASVDRWQRKTLLATGRAALRGEMRALNQSLSQQVAALLAEPGRAIERVQRRPEAAVQVLCEVGVAGSGPATFDDTAFYQVLLQELLESADAGVAYGAAVQVCSDSDCTSIMPIQGFSHSLVFQWFCLLYCSLLHGTL
jgi:protein AATF/BFR2